MLGVLGTPGQCRLDSTGLQTRIDSSVERGGTRPEWLTGGSAYVYEVALSASRSLLAATTGVNGDVRLSDLGQPARPTLLATIAQRGVTAQAVSPDEALQALGDQRG